MSENTPIEWTTHTFNGWIGCTEISQGCERCYAKTLMETRLHKVKWGAGMPRMRTSEANWRLPLKWNANAAKFAAENGGLRQQVFCSSLADVFDNEVPDQWREDVFQLIAGTPNLDWQLLTKRIVNVRKMLPAEWKQPGGWPKHVRLGITVENQTVANRDISKLIALDIPNFISMEPLLEQVDIRAYLNQKRRSGHPAIDQVIAGGESGQKSRYMHEDWARSLRDQCKESGVPFFMKQMGGIRKPFRAIPDDLMIRQPAIASVP